MANRKKEVYKPKPMTEGKQAFIQGLLGRGEGAVGTHERTLQRA